MNTFIENDEVEIDLKELLLELLSKWYIFLFCIVVCAGTAFGYTKFYLKPVYQSTSELYVLTKSTSITSLADIQTGTSLTRDYIEIVAGRPVLDKVIENLELQEDFESLKAKVSIETPSNSRIIMIHVNDSNPKHAKEITDEIAKVSSKYIAEKMSQDPPSIIQYGYADEGPIGPNTKKNTTMGCVLGVIAAGMFLSLRFIFNDTVVTPEDMEKKIGINVLATLPLESKSEYDGAKGKRNREK